jgi:hypothetical protein
MAVQVASANELAAYFRQRQAVEDGGRWYGGVSYEGGFDQWIQWPEWLSARCDDRYSALDAGGCCRDSGNTVIRLALNLSDIGQDILAAFGRGDRGCAATAADLAPLLDAMPQFVAAIRAALPSASDPSASDPSASDPSASDHGADDPGAGITGRALAVQLGCALDRLSLFAGRLAAGRRCPWRCGRHGRPDMGADLVPLRRQIDECSGAIWDVLHPRVRT